jgi:hypothetical protein
MEFHEIHIGRDEAIRSHDSADGSGRRYLNAKPRDNAMPSFRLRIATICTLPARTASPLCSTTSFVRATRRMCSPLSSGSIQASAPRTAELALSTDLEAGGGGPTARAPTTEQDRAAPAAARGGADVFLPHAAFWGGAARTLPYFANRRRSLTSWAMLVGRWRVLREGWIGGPPLGL